MDYGKRILGKLGWKEGQGLGKNSNGLVKPIKANLKFDNLGFGADLAASDFNNHWWERVYTDASGNIDVKEDTDGDTVRMALKNEDNEVEIITKSYSIKKLKKAKQSATEKNGYNNFLKSATLTNGSNEIETKNKVNLTDIAVPTYRQLSDEELFRACGGRTAHKGARHGLKLSGKLARLEQQEQEILAKMQLKSKNDYCVKDSADIKNSKHEPNSKLCPESTSDSAEPKSTTKTSKRQKKKNLSEINECQISDSTASPKKKKMYSELITENSFVTALPNSTKISIKQKNKDLTENFKCQTLDTSEPSKKKKKKSH